MDNVVLINDLRNHISRVIEEVRYGVADQRSKGLICDMPDEIAFDCEVVFEFQALEIRRGSTTEGGDVRVSNETTTDNGSTTRTSAEQSRTAQGHDQTTVEKLTYAADG